MVGEITRIPVSDKPKETVETRLLRDVAYILENNISYSELQGYNVTRYLEDMFQYVTRKILGDDAESIIRGEIVKVGAEKKYCVRLL